MNLIEKYVDELRKKDLEIAELKTCVARLEELIKKSGIKKDENPDQNETGLAETDTKEKVM